MTIRFVDSNAVGTNDGSTWANAWTSLKTGIEFAGGADDDFIYVSSVHAEALGGSTTMTFAKNYRVLCAVNPTNVITTGAVVGTQATNFDITLQGAKIAYIYGITFQTGTNTSSGSAVILNESNGGTFFLDTCTFVINGSGAATFLPVRNSTSASTSNYTRLVNCTIKFSNVTQTIPIRGNLDCIKLTIDLAGSIPTTLFANAGGNTGATLLCVDCDFSIASTNLVGNPTTTFFAKFFNCKLPTTLVNVKLANTITTKAGTEVIVVQSDSTIGGASYRHERWDELGSHVIETTIVRSGGASNGTTPISWKIVTTANSRWIEPFDCLPIWVWNDSTVQNVTLTVYGIWGGGAVPNNDDIWIEADYMGSSTTPLGTLNATNTVANPTVTGTGQAADSSSWGGSTTPFKMSITLSSPQPQMKGPIYVRVRAAKPSSTFYIDPKVDITNTSGLIAVRQYAVVPGAFANESAAPSGSATTLMGQACI